MRAAACPATPPLYCPRCDLLPVSLDEYGLVPAHLDALLTARQAAGLAMPKLLYTIPTGQRAVLQPLL